MKHEKKVLTLCIIQHAAGVLLGLKKRGFGAGKWNGFGGKVEPGETIEAAARREVREEAGIEVLDLEEFGTIIFTFEQIPDVLEVHVFRATQFTGEPHETEEMKPCWYALAAIPYDQMWADDQYWLPLLLAGKRFNAQFNFIDEEKIRKYRVLVK